MYPNVFLELCNILRERTPLQNTRFIFIKEMLAVFLLTVGQNYRYYLVRKTFGQSHFTTCQFFNKILRVLNKVAIDWTVKSSSSMPMRIRESTRFYPYFKVGALSFLFFIYFFIIILLLF